MPHCQYASHHRTCSSPLKPNWFPVWLQTSGEISLLVWLTATTEQVYSQGDGKSRWQWKNPTRILDLRNLETGRSLLQITQRLISDLCLGHAIIEGNEHEFISIAFWRPPRGVWPKIKKTQPRFTIFPEIW
jgi:hypothetical protein